MAEEEESLSSCSSITSSSFNNSSTVSSSNSDIIANDDEVDQLLEHFYQESNVPTHIEKTKSVLKKRGQDYFEVLPEGWIEVTHSSGIPIYLHKQSRVCVLSKPYYLGGGSVRRHEIPLTAIPCLQYRKELDKEKEREKIKEEQSQEEKQNLDGEQQNQVLPKAQLPTDNVALETVQNHKKEKWLNACDVRQYCEKLFEFNEIKIRKFKTWKDRRKHNSIIREQKQRPSLPNDTKLITCSTSGNSSSKKEFVMNPAGKSFVCILHEFVQHKEKVQPRYHYKELENAVNPYSATAVINNTSYGVGYGKSKKDAKEEAARRTIEILIPGIKDITDTKANKSSEADASQDLKFFDSISVVDQRITDLCAKAGLHSPYQILVECLKRNAGTCNTEIEHSVQLIKHHKNVYTMKVGKHEAKVDCKNKKEGKQRAAQVILQELHPQVTNWGGLLLMYGKGSYKTPKEKKEEEQKITELQSTASPNTPNYAILKKLKEEMSKLKH